jgi:putative hydrolase
VKIENKLIKFKNYFQTGLWHVHTNFTDGDNTVFELCKFCNKKGIPLIAFTEHVRKENMSYIFDDLVKEINLCKEKFPNLIILLGCEAKVVDEEGNLDLNDEIKAKCDLILGAFHSFIGHYLSAMKNMILKREIDIFAHPFLYALKNNIQLSEKEINEILYLCKQNGILIEKNLRYPEVAKLLNGDILSYDLHSLSDY